MPQLPKRNTLDFAPDSIISASKKMSVVQSSQMKDASEMDAVVRPIKNENDTKREMGRFTNTIGEIADIFNRIRQLGSSQGYKELTEWGLADLQEGAGRRHLARLYGGMDPSEEGLSAMSGLFNEPKKARAPRKKKVELIISDDATVDLTPNWKPPQVRSIVDYFERMSSSSPRKTGTELPRHVSNADYEDRQENRGQARSEARSDDVAEVFDADGGDGYDSDPSSSSSELTSTDYSDNTRGIDVFRGPDTSGTYRLDPREAIVQNILKATKLIREADSIALAIKDYRQYLSGSDIEELKMAYNVLIKKWEFFVAPFGGFDFITWLSHSIDFVENMLKVLNDERKKLMMDIIITVNSYNANDAISPAFDPKTLIQPVKNVLDSYGTENITAEMIGSGRNFYGKTINATKDIPTIWGARQSCPTKYLL
jgi:hypothetical protein